VCVCVCVCACACACSCSAPCVDSALSGQEETPEFLNNDEKPGERQAGSQSP